VAVFARVIDGDSLWLAVDGAPAGSRAALVRGKEQLPLDDDADDAAAAAAADRYLSVRADLTRLDWEAGTPYQLCVGGPRDWTPVTSAELPRLDPVRVPTSRDGEWRHELRRADDGTLTLTREPRSPGIPYAGLGVEDDAVVVTLADGTVTELVLDADGTEVRRPVAGGRCEVRPSDLPDAAGVSYRVLARTPSGDRPVVRRDHDLARPNRALLLPEIADADGVATLRVRIEQDGALVVRRLGEAT
jgi:hypothetical protein